MSKTHNLLKDIHKIELDPSKSYILFLPAPAPLDVKQLVQRVWYFSGVSPYDFPAMSPRILPRYSERAVLENIERLYDALKERGIDNMIVMIENPQDIRIIETPTHD